MAGELPGAPEELVRAELNRADSLRRAIDAERRLWRAAPLFAAACAAVATLGRILGWPAIVALALLALSLLSLVLYALVARRAQTVTDRVARELDERASLEGELRSAYWFAGHETRDAWIDYHLARAAERLKGIDWRGLYPVEGTGRAKTATALLAVATLLFALYVPGRAGIFASGSTTDASAPAARGRNGEGMPTAAQILAKLEKLLVAAETGNGRAISSAEVRGLLEQLDKLLAEKKTDAEAARDAGARQSKVPTAAELKAFAERAKKASESDEVSPETRDALAEMSDKLNEQAQAQSAAPKDPRDASTPAEAESGESAQAASGNSNKQDPSAQSVKEAAGAGGVGVVMMTGDAASSKEAGLGLGGASGTNPKNGQMVDLGAALRKETVEAAQEDEGQKNVTGERRQTERGSATATYSHTTAAASDRGRSAAPPAVPEARRAALRSYFIRKQ